GARNEPRDLDLVIDRAFRMDQLFQMAKPMCNGYRIHLFYESGETLCVPEQIPEFGKFASYIVVWDTDIVPIAVFPGDHMEIRAATCDFCFITGIGIVDEPDFSLPVFFPSPSCKCALILHRFLLTSGFGC